MQGQMNSDQTAVGSALKTHAGLCMERCAGRAPSQWPVSSASASGGQAARRGVRGPCPAPAVAAAPDPRGHFCGWSTEWTLGSSTPLLGHFSWGNVPGLCQRFLDAAAEMSLEQDARAAHLGPGSPALPGQVLTKGEHQAVGLLLSPALGSWVLTSGSGSAGTQRGSPSPPSCGAQGYDHMQDPNPTEDARSDENPGDHLQVPRSQGHIRLRVK